MEISRALLAVLVTGSVCPVAAESPLREKVEIFLEDYCYDCHDSASKKGGLDLEELSEGMDDPAIFAEWLKVHDRVVKGEMPPKKKDQPSAEELQEFLASLGEPLTLAHAKSKGTVMRRLNRREYQNTINDLFGTRLELADKLPEDALAHGFDNVGHALGMSSVQLERYLESADRVLAEVSAPGKKAVAPKKWTSSFLSQKIDKNSTSKAWLIRKNDVVFFSGGNFPPRKLQDTRVKEAGFYRVKVRGHAYQSSEPLVFEVAGSSAARGATRPTLAYLSLAPGSSNEAEFTTWFDKGYGIEINPQFSDGGKVRQVGPAKYDGPGLAIESVEMEGPLGGSQVDRGRALLGLGRPEGEADQVLLNLATQAFRRPVKSGEIGAYTTLYRSQRDAGSSHEEALKAAAAAILCAPDFLFLRERPGRLDDFALASRLSYFLNRTAPDDALLKDAAAGRLSKDPAAMRSHLARLMADEKFDRFVVDFTDAWLDLRNIEFTNPDTRLFPEFDRYLQWSMLEESRGFFRMLVKDNLPVRNIVKADFAMLNDRLAKHYGIEGVSGSELRPVKLPPNHVRGGFISQASVLKVSANGNNTSPVVRGVWVMERILGTPPSPPPAGVPGIEPDIRGAKTLREILEKHRDLENCRGCHMNIDPPGFALESFNPIGGWRDRFRSLGEGEKVTGPDGKPVKYKLGPPVDSAGQTADGRNFAGFLEFREYLAADQKVLAKTLTKKLLTFATGREMGFSDRAEIERIAAECGKRGYGVRDLFELVVTSPIFLNK